MECVSQCPDGTYINYEMNVCDLCDTKKCIQCIKEPTMCIKCSNSLALDTSNFNCKSCCKQDIITESCCECPLQFSGFCQNSNFSQYKKLEIINLNLKIKIETFPLLNFIFLFVVIIVFIVSIIFFRFNKKINRKFDSVEYSYLNINDDNIS